MRSHAKLSISDSNDSTNEESEKRLVIDKFLSLKTYGQLRKDYAKFVSLGNSKKLAKHCHSTINKSLFEENDDVYMFLKNV